MNLLSRHLPLSTRHCHSFRTSNDILIGSLWRAGRLRSPQSYSAKDKQHPGDQRKWTENQQDVLLFKITFWNDQWNRFKERIDFLSVRFIKSLNSPYWIPKWMQLTVVDRLFWKRKTEGNRKEPRKEPRKTKETHDSCESFNEMLAVKVWEMSQLKFSLNERAVETQTVRRG